MAFGRQRLEAEGRICCDDTGSDCTQASAVLNFNSLPLDGNTFDIQFLIPDMVFTFKTVPTQADHIPIAGTLVQQAQNFFDTVSAWLLSNQPGLTLTHSGVQETFTATPGGDYDCSPGNDLILVWFNPDIFLETSPLFLTGGTG